MVREKSDVTLCFAKAPNEPIIYPYFLVLVLLSVLVFAAVSLFNLYMVNESLQQRPSQSRDLCHIIQQREKLPVGIAFRCVWP